MESLLWRCDGLCHQGFSGAFVVDCYQYWWPAPSSALFFPHRLGIEASTPLVFLVIGFYPHFVSIVNAGTVGRDFSALSCCHLEVSLRKFPRCLKLCQKSGRNPALNSYCITTHPQPLDYTAWYDILYFSVFTLSSECSIHPPSVADKTPAFVKQISRIAFSQPFWKHCISYFLVPVCSSCLLCTWLFFHCSRFRWQRLQGWWEAQQWNSLLCSPADLSSIPRAPGREIEPTPHSCPLMSTCILWDTCPYAYAMNTHNNNDNLIFKKTFP